MISFKKTTLALMISSACIASCFAIEINTFDFTDKAARKALQAAYRASIGVVDAEKVDYADPDTQASLGIQKKDHGAGHQLVFNTETLHRFLSTKSDPDSRGHDKAERIKGLLRGVYGTVLNAFSGDVSDLKAALESAGPIVVEVGAINPRAAEETADQVLARIALARIAPRRHVDRRLEEWMSGHHGMAHKDGHFVRADEASDLGTAARYSAAQLVEMDASPEDYVRVGKKGTVHPFEAPGQIEERKRAIVAEAAREGFSSYGTAKHYLRMGGGVDALKAENDVLKAESDALKAQIAYLQAQLAAASAPKE